MLQPLVINISVMLHIKSRNKEHKNLKILQYQIICKSDFERVLQHEACNVSQSNCFCIMSCIRILRQTLDYCQKKDNQ